MNFEKFPFDTQKCKIEFRSYGYQDVDLVYAWSTTGIRTSKNIQLPDYTIDRVDPAECTDSPHLGLDSALKLWPFGPELMPSFSKFGIFDQIDAFIYM